MLEKPLQRQTDDVGSVLPGYPAGLTLASRLVLNQHSSPLHRVDISVQAVGVVAFALLSLQPWWVGDS